MFPLIYSLGVHTIYFLQHFTWTHLNLEWRVGNNVQKHFWRKIYVRSKLSCVRSPHDMCARSHAHNLEGTLTESQEFQNRNCGTWWRIGWVDSSQPEDRGLDSRSSRHVGTLGKSLTHSCLWRFGVKLLHNIRAVSGALLSRNGLEEAL